MNTAVQIKLPYNLEQSPRAVITQFKTKTSFQGQERNPVSPNLRVKVGSSSIDDLTTPLTITFQGLWSWKENSIECSFRISDQENWIQSGCNVNRGVNSITSRCDHLGFFFAVTLESEDLFDDEPDGDPFKVTTWSNYSNNANVTTPMADIPCETSLESTTSIPLLTRSSITETGDLRATSSSTGRNQTCYDKQQQLTNLHAKNQYLEAVGIASTFIENCFDQVSNITTISLDLENILTEIDFEGESKAVETKHIICYIRKTKVENFQGIQFPNSDADKNGSSILNNVIGIRVGNTSIDNLTDHVIIVFNKTSSEQNNTKCVFWELEQNGNTSIGHWNESGCTTENTDNQTICKCNHLTFFAVLLQLDESQPLDEKILKSLTYITQIGCGVSAIFTAVTVILHFLLRKKHRECSIQIHVNLSAALFLLNVNFLTNIWLSSINIDSLCKTIAVFLHYSLLCSFTWMGIEAFHLYIMLIKVFNIYIKLYMLKLCLVGWAIPAAVLIIVVGVSTDNYGRYSIPIKGNNSSPAMCWITNKTVHYVTNFAYFILIFLGNTIMLIILCAKMIKLKGINKNSIFTILGLTCLLGITYGIMLFSHGPLTVPAMYLFSILNPLQGFFVFLWYYMLTRSSNTMASETSKTSKSHTANETI
ncbi:adhesion G protein-coupled receptor G3-like isoform X2 [Heptranchias perlo]|uniref:adhesion G protein-coupled receptor G3-like isoform X2 n=1 Tax=Heptranchias perlo TaxID=212740 RepID=UPI00355965F5